MKFLIVELSIAPFSSILGPNILLKILFSNTLSLRSSLNVRDHVLRPYSTTDNIIALYIFYTKGHFNVQTTEIYQIKNYLFYILKEQR